MLLSLFDMNKKKGFAKIGFRIFLLSPCVVYLFEDSRNPGPGTRVSQNPAIQYYVEIKIHFI